MKNVKVKHKENCKMKRVIWIISMILLMLLQTGCSYYDGNESSQNTPDASTIVYSNTDYSVKFIKSIASASTQNMCVYKDTVYYVGTPFRLLCVSFTDAVDGTDQKIDMISSDCIQRVCTDPLCPENTLEGLCKICPASLYSPDSRYLIDNSESGGEFPVFYYSRPLSSWFDEDKFDNGEEGFIVNGNYVICRYDVSNNQRKVIVEQEDPITDFSVYGDLIFFVTTDKDGNYKIVIADKSGKTKYETSELKNKIDLIGYENGTLYYADLEGNVYAALIDKKDDRLIFSVPSFVLLDSEPTSRMFIEQGFLYFDSELIYKEEQFTDAYGNMQTFDLPFRTISRIPLDDPRGNAQVVAENVFQSSVHGICGGKLFYCKLTPGGSNAKGGYWNFCGGNIYSVDLSTLETELFANDIGMQFDLSMSYFSERFCVGVMAVYAQSYTEMYDENNSGGQFMCCLYDFVTGQLYVLPI